MNKDIEILENEIANLTDKVKELKEVERIANKSKKDEIGKAAIGKFFKTIYEDNFTYYRTHENINYRGTLYVYADITENRVRYDIARTSYSDYESIGYDLKTTPETIEITKEEFLEAANKAINGLLGENLSGQSI